MIEYCSRLLSPLDNPDTVVKVAVLTGCHIDPPVLGNQGKIGVGGTELSVVITAIEGLPSDKVTPIQWHTSCAPFVAEMRIDEELLAICRQCQVCGQALPVPVSVDFLRDTVDKNSNCIRGRFPSKDGIAPTPVNRSAVFVNERLTVSELSFRTPGYRLLFQIRHAQRSADFRATRRRMRSIEPQIAPVSRKRLIRKVE